MQFNFRLKNLGRLIFTSLVLSLLSSGLRADEIDQRSIATGFFITDTGYLVTSYHVIANYNKVSVLVNKKRLYEAKIINYDEELDLALLKIKSITPFVYLSHSKGVPAGMEVVTIGYPQVAIQGLEPKITKGIVNSSKGLLDDKNSFQFSAEVQKGNSGGPLIGPGGTVVGVVQSKLDALKISEKTNDLTQNVNYSTKSSVLLKFIEGTPGLPTTRLLQPEQPLKPIRIYIELQKAIVPVVAEK
jgi:S1-C subfamily serine protease